MPESPAQRAPRVPKVVARRSKEGRDAIEREAAKDRERRRAEAEAEGRAEEERDKLRYGIREGRGRGGNQPISTTREIANIGRGTRGGFMGQSSRSRGGSSAAAAKSSSSGSSNNLDKGKRDKGDMQVEDTLRAEREPRVNIDVSAPTASRRRVVKTEDDTSGYQESDDEVARGVDVEHLDSISISSDDGDHDGEPIPVDGQRRSPTATGFVRQRPLMPVRLRRSEHVERHVGMNTEASSLSLSAQRRRVQKAARGQPDTRGEGVGQDAGLEDEAGEAAGPEDGPAVEEMDLDELPTRMKRRGRTKSQSRQPRNEEEREQMIHDTEMNTIYEELVTRSMEEREGNIYLFQLPPKLPDLISVEEKVKKEKDATPQPPPSPEDNDAGQQNGKTGARKPIKEEEEQVVEDVPEVKSVVKRFRPPTGKVGTLRVYAGGRTKMMWGDVNMMLSMGMDAHFLQTVVLMDPQTSVRELGRATSMGQVRGKFVVTPDLDELFASEKRR